MTKQVSSILALLMSVQVSAHPDHGPIADWNLIPDYRLPGSGATLIVPRDEQPVPSPGALETATPPLMLFGEHPTERRTHLLPDADLKTGSFTVELWLLDHVNRPVGTLIALREKESALPVWTLGYHDDRLYLHTDREGFADSSITVSDLPRGWKKYWHQVVATHDGHRLTLYHNGELAGTLETGPIEYHGDDFDLELAAYMENERFMCLENLLKGVRLYDYAIDRQSVLSMFEERKGAIEQGELIPGSLHFSAGPYLHMATRESISVSWETPQPSVASIEYGTSVPLEHTLEISDPASIHEARITGLEPDMPYFYRIIAESGDERIDSGILSFKTASLPGEPVRFAVMGDPEARPHINDRLAGLIWNERPDFMLQVGDLTDGGKQDHKFQWNHEYFLAMTQLNSRLPVYPVPGNGESDLYWYSRYHNLPSPDEKGEGYYTFEYGDIQFFMLDSNRSEQDFRAGGAQFEWLKSELERSTAKWKIAAHHHPTYTSDENDYGNTWETTSPLGDLDVRRITDLYERYGVDVVFFGHLHTYERTLPIRNDRVDRGGVVYVQAGGGGGNLEDFAPTPSWFSGKVHRGHHYVMCHQFGDELEIRMYNDEQAMLDIYKIKK
ncbi:MAG: metallophosphoesterase [Phycisphaerales bacterium JB052]